MSSKFSLYDKNGYLSIENIINEYNPTTIMLIGGRSIGKTYSILKYLLEHKIKFHLLRRTKAQADILKQKNFNPLTPLVEDGIISDFDIISHDYTQEYKINDDVFATAGGLSTFGNIRGFNGRSIKAIFYDEFIRLPSERVLKNEMDLYSNVYVTINRQREIIGEPPVLQFFAANSNNIFNPITLGFHVTDDIIKMRERDDEYIYIKSKRFFLADIRKSPISDKLKDTYYFNLIKDSDYYNMSLYNDYNIDVKDFIGNPFPFREYKPFCQIKKEKIYIVKHSSKPIYYVTYKNRGASKSRYTNIDNFFKENYLFFYEYFHKGFLFFEDMQIAGFFVDNLL